MVLDGVKLEIKASVVLLKAVCAAGALAELDIQFDTEGACDCVQAGYVLEGFAATHSLVVGQAANTRHLQSAEGETW